MSRIVVFDKSNMAVGEFTGIVTGGMGWSLGLGGGSCTVTITDDVSAKGWIQIGRMVLVSRQNLPLWAGVIDTPWKATSPIQVTLYNAEYLMSLRRGDSAIAKITSEPCEVIAKLIEYANQREPMYVTAGAKTNIGSTISYTPDTRTYLEQVTSLASKYGLEISIRASYDSNRRLYIYVDTYKSTGITTNVLLHDGADGNVELKDAKVTGTITNYVVGKNNASTNALYSSGEINSASITTYRLRSYVVTVQNTNVLTQLTAAAKSYLALNSLPKLSLTLSVIDQPGVFASLRVGNTVPLRLSLVHLPGGVRGWKGTGRIKAMSYDETTNQVDVNLEATL